MKCFTALALTLSLTVPLFAVDGDGAQYLGGTLSVKEKTEGKLSTASESETVFTPKDKKLKPIAIPYAAITGLEYGQKAGRRVAVAVMISPLALFSKKRNHYLTVTFKDADGKEQAAVLELGKDIVRTTLKVLEVRSGQKIEYQDEEARKSGIGS